MTQETWTDKEWRDLSIEARILHNGPVWIAHANRVPTQWWNGRKWADEDYHGANPHEHVQVQWPLRIKPGCTVQPVELRIVKEDSDVSSVKTA